MIQIKIELKLVLHIQCGIKFIDISYLHYAEPKMCWMFASVCQLAHALWLKFCGDIEIRSS